MASGSTSVPTADSRTSKKKKGKTEGGSNPSAETTTPNAEATVSGTATNGTDGVDVQGDSPYLRELSKSVRNIAKKITASSKTEAIANENPSLSLDDLIANKKINADQKAQLLKKPGLQAEKARLEDQIVHYRKFGKEYEDRFSQEKAALEESHATALTKFKLEAAEEAAVTARKNFDEDLLVLSQFLHAAAAKRQDEDLDPVEKAAFEGVLLLVYQGNNAALTAFKDIAAGTEKRVSSTEGDEVDFTYAQVKQISMRDASSLLSEEPVGASLDTEYTAAKTSTDPTIANAGMTELTDSTNYGQSTEPVEENLMAQPEQSSISADTANAAAQRSWDPQASMVSDTPSREEWVEVPRDPAETDTGTTATPAAIHGSGSWAEEVNADAATEVGKPPAVESDGFEQVVHHHQTRGRGRGPRGDLRGRGRGGEQRGRGRGDRDRGDGGRFRANGDRRGGGSGGGSGGGGRGPGRGRGGGRGRDFSTANTSGDAGTGGTSGTSW